MYASRRRLLTRSRRRAGRDRARRTRRKTMVRASRKRRQRDSVCLPAQRSSVRRRIAAPRGLGHVTACAPPPVTRQITEIGMLERCAESRNEPLRGRRRRCYSPARLQSAAHTFWPGFPVTAICPHHVEGLQSLPVPARSGLRVHRGRGSPHLWMGVWICRCSGSRGSRRMCRTVGAHWSTIRDSKAGKG